MPNPFPGMDPYLEGPDVWPEFRHALVRTLYQILLPGLVDRYRPSLGRRRYGDDALDVAPHEEEYVEIREREGGKLITLLDIVGPNHKTTGAGRQAYLRTRREGRDAGASVVEVDLVLQGQHTLEYSREGLPAWDYAVTVSRATGPERFEIYSGSLQKRLPRFRLPLAADDRDTVLDLHMAVARIYDTGGFAAKIDYGSEPPVPLSAEYALWVDATLTAKGLRPAAPPEEQLAVAAYHVWEREGRPHGKDREHWRAALARLRRERDRPG